MATILHIDASVRSDRSLSRKLSKAFQPQEQLTDDKRRILAVSDELIEELRLAEVIVIGTPMYNYGMSAQLKSWFDNVIRIGKTFSFDLALGNYPLESIMSGKRLVILSSRATCVEWPARTLP